MDRSTLIQFRPLVRGGGNVSYVAPLHVNSGAIHRTLGSHLWLLTASEVPFNVGFWRGLTRI